MSFLFVKNTLERQQDSFAVRMAMLGMFLYFNKKILVQPEGDQPWRDAKLQKIEFEFRL